MESKPRKFSDEDGVENRANDDATADEEVDNDDDDDEEEEEEEEEGEEGEEGEANFGFTCKVTLFDDAAFLKVAIPGIIKL